MAGQRVEAQRDIIAEAADVWIVLADIDRYAKVLRSVEAVERLNGQGFDVGVTWRETRRVQGRLETHQTAVMLADPGRRAVLETERDGAVYRTELSLHPSGVGTRLRAELVIENPDRSAMARVTTSLFGSGAAKSAKAALDQDLEDFGHAIEHRSRR